MIVLIFLLVLLVLLVSVLLLLSLLVLPLLLHYHHLPYRLLFIQKNEFIKIQCR